LAAWQEVAPYSSRRHPSSFVVAAYIKVRLIPQDFGAWHLDNFEQPEKIIFSATC
jgi:hypothetical protein